MSRLVHHFYYDYYCECASILTIELQEKAGNIKTEGKSKRHISEYASQQKAAQSRVDELVSFFSHARENQY